MSRARSDQPNVLFVFTDQHSQRGVGCYGNPHVRTPHIDGLAAGGLRFEHSYCAAPVCGPSRASMQTGRFGHEVGVVFNEATPTAGSIRLGPSFRDAGYETAWAGPWHLPDHSPGKNPQQVAGFEYLGDPPPTARHGMGADGAIADKACAFLRRRHEQPFFLGVNFINPHDICSGVGSNIADPPLDPSWPPLPPNFARQADEPQFITEALARQNYGAEAKYTRGWTEAGWRRYLHVYHQYCAHADASVGRLLATLREQGLEESTLVVFTSDHGEGCAEHQWVVKLMFWEAVMRVPLIMRLPGRIAAGAVDRTHLASGVDLLPTMCDLAGIDVPAGITGTSLKPVIDDPSRPGVGYIGSEVYPFRNELKRTGRMIRSARHKYVAFADGERREMLFDLATDPGETRNFARNSTHAVLLDEHRRMLSDWIARTGDAFVTPQ